MLVVPQNTVNDTFLMLCTNTILTQDVEMYSSISHLFYRSYVILMFSE